jgi:GLPGLI family protein
MVFAQKELKINYHIYNGEWLDHLEKEVEMKAQNSRVFFKQTVILNAPVPNSDETIKITDSDLFYKDHSSNYLWSRDGKTGSIVKEEMNVFSWEFTQETDTILNYACRMAKTHFRGRDYIAWFTTDIPFRASPWKIHGLPGVVLKVKTTDGFYSLIATDLSIDDMVEGLNNPFQNKKTINWDEYVLEYKEWYEHVLKVWRSNGIKYGSKWETASPKLEIILEANRTTATENYERLEKADQKK